MAEAQEERNYPEMMRLYREVFEHDVDIDRVMRSKDANLEKFRVPGIHRQFDEIRTMTLERAIMGKNRLY
jgi:hypothetical protein